MGTAVTFLHKYDSGYKGNFIQMGPDAVLTGSDTKLYLHRCQDNYHSSSVSLPSTFSTSSASYDTDESQQYNIIANSGDNLVIYYRSSDLSNIAKLKYSDSSQKLVLQQVFDASSFGSRIAYYPSQNIAFTTSTTSSTYSFAIVQTNYLINLDISPYVNPATDLTTIIHTHRVYFSNGKLYSIFKLSQNTQCSGGTSWMLASINQDSYASAYSGQQYYTLCGSSDLWFAEVNQDTGRLAVVLKIGSYKYKLYSFDSSLNLLGSYQKNNGPIYCAYYIYSGSRIMQFEKGSARPYSFYKVWNINLNNDPEAIGYESPSYNNPTMGYGAQIITFHSQKQVYFDLDKKQVYGAIDQKMNQCEYSYEKAICVNDDKIKVFSQISSGVLYGSIFGGLAALIILVVLGIYLYKRWKRRKSNNQYGVQMGEKRYEDRKEIFQTSAEIEANHAPK